MNYLEGSRVLPAGNGSTKSASFEVTRYYFMVAAAILLLTLLYVSIFSATEKSADVVNGYLVGLDMGAGNWRLSHWYLPMDNFWLQDALAYALATRLFGNHPFFMIVLPALAWGGIVTMSWIISRRGAASKNPTWSLLVIGALLALPILRDNPLMTVITAGSIHGLTLLQALLLFLFADRFLYRGGYLVLGLLFLLATAAVASDPLAVFIAMVPIAGASLLAGKASLRRRLILTATAIVSIAAGYAIVRLNSATGGFTVVDDGPIGFYFAQLGDLGRNAAYTIEAIFAFSSADFFGLPVSRALPQLLHSPLLLLVAWVVAATTWQMAKGVLVLRPVAFEFLDCALALGAVLLTLSCLFSTVMVGFWSGHYLLAVVVFGAILGARSAPKFPSRMLVGASALFGSLLAANAYALTFHPVLGLRSDAPKLEHWLENRGLQFGYAQYWTASPVTILSRGKVTVRAIIGDKGHLSPYLWISRGDWYPSALGSRRPFFVILDPPGAPQIFKISDSEAFFGVPSERAKVADCTVDIYR